MRNRHDFSSYRTTRTRLAGLAAAAVGLWGTSRFAAAQTVILADGFTNGTAGNSLVGGTPDTTDVPGSSYLQNGALVFPVTYANVGGTSFASVGADSGAGIATGISSTVAYQIQATYNNDYIGDTAGTLQRGEGLGFFSALNTGYNGYHGVDYFTGIVVSPAGDVRLVSVGGPGTNEPVVNEISDYVVPGYDNTVNHTLSYTANTSSGLVTNVKLDGNTIPLPDTTSLFTPGNTVYAGFTASGNAGGQVALFNNFSVSETAVVGPVPPTFWAVNGSGDWNVASNWTAGVPNAVGAEADLTTALTANHTIYTDVPITVGKLVFNNSTASYAVTGAVGSSLTMQASSGSATILVQAGLQKVNLPLTIASNTSFNVATGSTLLISDPLTINPGLAVTTTSAANGGGGTVTYQSTVTVGNNSTFALAAATVAHAFTVNASSAVTIPTTPTGSHGLLQLDSLALDPTAKLDLANNALLVHNGSVATLSALAKTGLAGTAGLVSSTAAANASHNTAVGVVANTAPGGSPLYGSGTTLGLFNGVSPVASDVLVRYTYYGDTNLDGKVDGSDYARVDAGFLAKGALTGWYNGDFNYDGKVDASDYTLIDNAFNTQTTNLATSADPAGLSAAATDEVAPVTAAVPEPASAGVAAAAVALLAARRRQR